jgi:glycosyltransferase involved in cell wall biosynthesis
MSAVPDSGLLFGTGSSYAGAEATRALPDDVLGPRIQPLSILVVTNMYPAPESPYYGTFVAEQVEGLRRLDGIADVDVVFIDGRTNWTNYLRGAREVRKAMARRRYDVVHAHHGLAGAVAVTQSRVPVVITFHGSDLSYYAWQRWISRLAARRAAVNVCVSAAAATKVRPGAVHLPCGIDLEQFAPVDRVSARRTFEVPEGAIALLFPGPRSHPQKAYPRFEEVRDALRSRGHQVHELRLENIDRASVPVLLAAADVMVMTSISEGSPVSIMEALAGGVPIVATDVGDVKSMVSGVQNCYSGAYDCEQFVRWVEAVDRSAPRVPTTRSRRFDQRRILAALQSAYSEVKRT